MKNGGFTNFWFMGSRKYSWFTNHKTLIPTLYSLPKKLENVTEARKLLLKSKPIMLQTSSLCQERYITRIWT